MSPRAKILNSNSPVNESTVNKIVPTNLTTANNINNNENGVKSHWKRQVRFDPCTRQTVQDGDTCAILALKYNITQQLLERYNGQLCGPDWPSQGTVVCVSEGGLPAIPIPFSDGSCSTYTVQPGDSCTSITQNNTFTISIQHLQQYNNQTCGSSFPPQGKNICISPGYLTTASKTDSKGEASPMLVPILICVMIFIVLIGVLCVSKRKKKPSNNRK